MYVLQFGNSCKIPSQITWQSQIHTLKPDDFNLRRVGNLSHRQKEPTMTCGSAPLINPRPQFPMPLWNFLQVRFYEKRYIPDFHFWSRLPCRFTESIAKKWSPNEMSSWGASLALGKVHRKDAFRGIQTSLDLWLPSKLHAGPFGTSLTVAFPQGPGQVPGGSTLIGVCTTERNHKALRPWALVAKETLQTQRNKPACCVSRQGVWMLQQRNLCSGPGRKYQVFC